MFYFFDMPVFILLIITTSLFIAECLLMVTKVRRRADRRADVFHWYFIFIFAGALTIVTSTNFTDYQDLISKYANWLDVLSMLPQIVLTKNSQSTGIVNFTTLVFWSVFKLIAIICFLLTALFSPSGNSAEWLMFSTYVLLYSLYFYTFYKVYKMRGSLFPRLD